MISAIRHRTATILYADPGSGPEWCEKYLADRLTTMGIYTELVDALDEQEPQGEVLINRVYGSLHNGNGLVGKSLRISGDVESSGRKVINTTDSMVFDYDKWAAYEMLVDNGVPTPRTYKIKDGMSLQALGEKLGYPFILKRNTGGRSIGIEMIRDAQHAESAIQESMIDPDYHGEMIVQKFIRPADDHDARIGIIGGEHKISYGRTLISLDNEKPWLASYSRGSRLVDHEPTAEEVDIAKAAARSLGADICEVDMYPGVNGPVVIEVNFTPNYIPGEEFRLDELARFIAESK